MQVLCIFIRALQQFLMLPPVTGKAVIVLGCPSIHLSETLVSSIFQDRSVECLYFYVCLFY